LELVHAVMTDVYEMTFGDSPRVRMRSSRLKASVRDAATDAQCSRAL
jgi:hypothetical protein